jgi:hypothetical protein
MGLLALIGRLVPSGFGDPMAGEAEPDEYWCHQGTITRDTEHGEEETDQYILYNKQTNSFGRTWRGPWR